MNLYHNEVHFYSFHNFSFRRPATKTNTKMYGVLESVRNSTFRNPFVTPVNCESAADNSTQNLVAGRTIAAASVAEGGIYLHHDNFSPKVQIDLRI